MIGLAFSSVRILCRSCGWHRPLGLAGQYDGRRAVIRIQDCSDPCNILSARTRFFPIDKSLAEIAARQSGYRDLHEDATNCGLFRMLLEFQPLFFGKCCPRCHASDAPSLDMITQIPPLRY